MMLLYRTLIQFFMAVKCDQGCSHTELQPQTNTIICQALIANITCCCELLCHTCSCVCAICTTFQHSSIPLTTPPSYRLAGNFRGKKFNKFRPSFQSHLRKFSSQNFRHAISTYMIGLALCKSFFHEMLFPTDLRKFSASKVSPLLHSC